MFKWNFQKDVTKDIYCVVKDKYGAVDSHDLLDAYSFEPDLVVSGEPKITVDDPRTLTDEGYLKGGVNLKIGQIGVHFQDAPSISPPPSDVEVGIEDDHGGYWPYSAHSRDQLNDINFAIPIPRYDGRTEFVFKVVESPGNSFTEGSKHFVFLVDSTAPALGDFRYEFNNEKVMVDWAVKEAGSGISLDEINYRITWEDGTNIRWKKARDPEISSGRLSFDLELDEAGLEKGKMRIALDISDMVGNIFTSDDSYYVTIDPTPDHDLSIDSSVSISPDPVIVNQITHFRTTISNKGTCDESEILVEVMRDGQLVTRIIVPFLAAGSTREIRWEWKAVEGNSNFDIIVDPYGAIDDLYPENNRIQKEVSSEYLDVFMRPDYMFFSDNHAEEMDLVTISFGVRSIGSIESGPINILFRQDNKFMGSYQVGSIGPDGSSELTIDWKVDSSQKEFLFEVDPYNEIIESVEDNNIALFNNPYYAEQVPIGDEETAPQTSEDDIDKEKVSDSEQKDPEFDREEGMVFWTGPVNDEDPLEGEPTPAHLPDRTPSPLSGNDEDSEIAPFILPAIGTIIGTASVGLSVALIRNELLRFRFMGLLIPLYSKIKKSKIDKGVRGEILGYLKAKPGANYSELKKNLDLNDGSLVHHLRILEREERIYSKKMGKYKLFYVTAYRRNAEIQDYISPLQMRILDIIDKNPGMVPKKLSRILDRSQTDMSYHLSELSRNGLLTKKKKGRNIHYFVKDEFAGTL
ncbi:MAG: CARDB domain-containing protein [Thermoplasmatota archaeon]